MGPQDQPIDLTVASDRILVGRAVDGDVRAFEALVRRYGLLIRVYAGRVLGSTADVDDVVQESLVQAWQHLPELMDPGAVKSWLMRIVSNKALDVLRRRREHGDITDHELRIPDDQIPTALVEKRSLEQALNAVLSDLPDQQRRCWVLREIGGYSYLEIGRNLDLPSSTVRGLIARARKNLIREMEGWR
ncbi:RNA polymerase sigma factor [Homoserinimonas sp. OAct 916]|uniref:RNA polymerase sigma factor n=1 Tax=Homoserinimonas sp. OAct 916 TaxID=2211450 RepID=UPI000DBE70A1|nr:RNA polymerase sigma factor [Homoserinimonas sp. OAct 916]